MFDNRRQKRVKLDNREVLDFCVCVYFFLSSTWCLGGIGT